MNCVILHFVWGRDISSFMWGIVGIPCEVVNEIYPTSPKICAFSSTYSVLSIPILALRVKYILCEGEDLYDHGLTHTRARRRPPVRPNRTGPGAGAGPIRVDCVIYFWTDFEQKMRIFSTVVTVIN